MGIRGLSSTRKALFALAGVLLITGVVFANGPIMAQIQVTQTVRGLTITLLDQNFNVRPNQNILPAVDINTPFTLVIRVDSTLAVSVPGLHLEIRCGPGSPVGGVMQVSQAAFWTATVGPGVDFGAPVDACSAPQGAHSIAKSTAPGGQQFWRLDIEYLVAGGTYTLDIIAHG